MQVIKNNFEKSVTIIPVSDIHLGSLECNEREWQSFCNNLLNQDDTYIVLVGDLINNSIRNSVANPFDEVLRPFEQKRRMISYLKPIKHKILAAVSGNHEYRTSKEVDQDITYDILCNLDLENIYRENIAFIKLRCGRNVYGIAITHGNGGGTLTGAAVNKNERFSYTIEGLDCLITAHTHKGVLTRPNRMIFDLNKGIVTLKPCTVLTTESWLSYGGYAARKMLLPAETCNPQKVIFSDNAHRKKIIVQW